MVTITTGTREGKHYVFILYPPPAPPRAHVVPPSLPPSQGLMVQYYGERTYARFYALETIARVPYFGYLCVLHLYETLGQWRQVRD